VADEKGTPGEPEASAEAVVSTASPESVVVDEALSDADEVDPVEASDAANDDVEDAGDDGAPDAEADPQDVPPVPAAVDASPVAAAVAEAPAAEPALDLAELGRRYEVSARFAEELRRGFRELKRQPTAAKRLPALLRGLARAHEPDARHASEQITQLIERIQAPPKDAS
jgi:hypothetical protein